ncbi:hypothetical protein PUN4_570210 [Paraburkholderia unamae]|nr:hypothetical protein PUN4_570210 [Paraburkholderia unamae]
MQINSAYTCVYTFTRKKDGVKHHLTRDPPHLEAYARTGPRFHIVQPGFNAWECHFPANAAQLRIEGLLPSS